MNPEEIDSYCERFSRERKGKKVRKMRRFRSDTKRRISGHGLSRYIQRVGPVSNVARDVDAARAHGKQWFQLPAGPLKDFLRGQTASGGRLVVFYKGYIYVFGKSKRNGPRDFITVYKYRPESAGEGESDES